MMTSPGIRPVPAKIIRRTPQSAPGSGIPAIGTAGRNAARLAEANVQKANVLVPSHDSVSDGEQTEGANTPAQLRERLRFEGGRGRMLSETVRLRLKPFLSFDPAIARIHRGTAAAREARTRRAQAFTIGTDIFFGERRFSPETRHGLGLLAHEMTHVGQQNRLLGRTQTRHWTGEGGDQMEKEAQDVAKRVLAAFSFAPPPLQPRTPWRPSLTFAISAIASPAPRETAPASFFTLPISSPLPLANPLTKADSKESGSETGRDPGPLQDRAKKRPFAERGRTITTLSARRVDASAVSERVYRLMRRELLLAKERGG